MKKYMIMVNRRGRNDNSVLLYNLFIYIFLNLHALSGLTEIGQKISLSIQLD